jgi:hypothetical protein
MPPYYNNNYNITSERLPMATPSLQRYAVGESPCARLRPVVRAGLSALPRRPSRPRRDAAHNRQPFLIDADF